MGNEPLLGFKRRDRLPHHGLDHQLNKRCFVPRRGTENVGVPLTRLSVLPADGAVSLAVFICCPKAMG